MSLAIKKMLMEMGLTDTETRVYIAMLELGPQSVQNIARKSDISRTAAYEIIEQLQKKGLASTFDKGKKTFFSAEDPEKLEDYFHGRVERMKTQMGELSRLMPELRVMKGGEHPRVRFYQGEEGVRALFRDLSAVGATEILEIADADVVYKAVDEKLLLELRKQESLHNIKMKILGVSAPRNLNPGAEWRQLDKSWGEVFANIWIYQNHIAFVNLLGDIEVVIVENKVFAQTLKVMFMGAWAASKPMAK